VDDENRKRKLEEESQKALDLERNAVKRLKLRATLGKFVVELKPKFAVSSMALLLIKEIHPFLSSMVCSNGITAVLCTGSSNGDLAFYDAQNSFNIFETVQVNKKLEAVNCIASLENSLVVAAGCDLTRFCLKTGKSEIAMEDAHDNEINVIIHTKLDSTDTMIFSCSLQGDIKCWLERTFDCLFSFQGHSDAVLTMTFFYEQSRPIRLISGSDDCTIMVWEFPVQNILNKPSAPCTTVVKSAEHTLKHHDDYIIKLCATNFKSDNFLISCSGDCSICIWDHKWTLVRTLCSDKMIVSMGLISNILFAAVREGDDLEECVLETYLIGTDVTKFGKGKKRIPILLPTCMLTAKAGEQLLHPFVATSAEEENSVHVWVSPYMVDSPHPNSVPPSVNTTQASVNYPGDLIAKGFLKNILQLDKLSPDMQRVLNLGLNLYEENL